jgi:hypothetical protein
MLGIARMHFYLYNMRMKRIWESTKIAKKAYSLMAPSEALARYRLVDQADARQARIVRQRRIAVRC